MQFSTATILSALALFATASPLASLEDAGPNPNEVYIQGMTYGGSGCPNGSVAQSISNDRQTFTLIFDSYIASVGPGVPITEGRKNCQLNVKMHYPQGWTFSLLSSDYRGYMQLDAGLRGTHKSTYYFAGDTRQVSTQADFPGPQNRDYLAHDVIGVTSLIWAPCGASIPLNINSQVRIDNSANPNGRGQLTTDSQDGKVSQLLHFQWRRC